MLKRVVYPGLARAGYLRHRNQSHPAVVTYHGVFPEDYAQRDPVLDGNLTDTAAFRRQLKLLKNHYHVISPEEYFSISAAQEPFSPRSVLLTCDDGLSNCFSSMLPMLQEEGLQCLFFVTGASLADDRTMLWYEELYLMLRDAFADFILDIPEINLRVALGSHIDRSRLWRRLTKEFSRFSFASRSELMQQVRIHSGLPPEWKSAYTEVPSLRSRYCTMTFTELVKLKNSGMSVGAHTASHPLLSEQPEDLAWLEISQNRIALKEALGCDIKALAYPFGNASALGERELEMARRAGFDYAFLNVEESWFEGASPFAIPRMHVTREMSLAEFEAHVSGFHQTLRHSLFASKPLEAATQRQA